MADQEKDIPLTYKGHPLRRKDNLIYYGSMADKYIIALQILSSEKHQNESHPHGLCLLRHKMPLLHSDLQVPLNLLSEPSPEPHIFCWMMFCKILYLPNTELEGLSGNMTSAISDVVFPDSPSLSFLEFGFSCSSMVF